VIEHSVLKRSYSAAWRLLRILGDRFPLRILADRFPLIVRQSRSSLRSAQLSNIRFYPSVDD
jgi:hypothetical protein